MIARTKEDAAIRAPAGWIVPEVVVRRVEGRAGIPPGIQLVCGAGPFELDVLVRDLEAERRLEFAGQVTLGGSVYEPVSGLPLKLVEAEGELAVASSTTDGFGEFDMESERSRQYGIRLGGSRDAPCVLVWEG